MILSYNFIYYNIQKNSTKFFSYIYLLCYFYWPIFLIYQTLFIYYKKLTFLNCIVDKYISYYLINKK